MTNSLTQWRAAFTLGALILCLVSVGDLLSHAQTPQPRGAIRLKVRYKTGDLTKELPRQRFFLIAGSLEENKALAETIKQTAITSRECYYRAKGASEQLIKWLGVNDCESIYCRAIEENYLTGSEAVPEFKSAYYAALTELKSPETARRWLPNYLPAEIRDGYYLSQQRAIDTLVKQAETLTGKPVMSIMTDRKGTAYLTDVAQGTYTISNLIPSETEKSNILWLCEREVKAADLSIAMRRPFILSNEKDPKVKCEVIERPLPVCEK
ncbi:MAG TPA: hypothetical protein VE961_23715 [Pyrinomonadaceae bacterium]|nr:hypothetical protein [Pyrinomonadaceae bacterium]